MEITRVFDFLYYQKTKYPKHDYLSHKIANKWKSYSTEETIDVVNALSSGLLALGVSPGDKIAIIGQNRPEWAFVDFAIQQIGAVSVPMYPTITVDDYTYIFDHAEVKIVFAENEELTQKVVAATAKKPLQAIYTFDKIEGQTNWVTLKEDGLNQPAPGLKKLMQGIKPTDLMTIIYTSGTTGKPKGVMLSHNNIVSNVIGVAPFMPIKAGLARSLSFLPMCHIYERTALFAYTYLGVSIYFAESMEKIADNMREVKPNTFNTVPRLLEKVYDKIVTKGYELTGLKRKLFFWALQLAHQYDPNRDMGAWYNFQHKWADKLIFSKWREALGGNIAGIASGAAALQPRLGKVFWAAGIKIGEGYGLTETSPVISASKMTKDEVRIGCVGQLIEGVQIKIAEDGEILAKGPNIMLGYYKEPDLTAQVIKDGWFHTGDIGTYEKGYLKITDRKKEMFKTSGGKYIAPQLLENKFKESPIIEYIMVVGEGKKFPAALIVPNFENLREEVVKLGIDDTDTAVLIENPKIIACFQRDIDKFNTEFGHWEQIKKFKLLNKPWTVETGELTPTLKLKRRVILNKCDSIIEEFYSN
jgi:long-chain acyl-CoA synthetase